MTTLRLYKLVRFGLSVLTGKQLVDSIEVFYLPETNEVFPINSKAGCSTVKLMLIRRFTPDFESGFPGIHQLDPATLTAGRIERIFFETVADYERFCADKQVVLVTRDPRRKFYSCYLDNLRGKNPMFDVYPRLRRLFGFDSPLSFRQFLYRCFWLPDRIADRHFRSQSFYIPRSVSHYQLIDISRFAEGAALDGAATAPPVLNKSTTPIPEEVYAYLENNRLFNIRYRRDLALLSPA